MKEKHKRAHMRAAFAYAECSTAKRLQVGCVIVKDDRIISIGYNGMPSGWTNECEEEVVEVPELQAALPENEIRYLVTKPEVLHAEMNALMKLARSTESGEDATAFITHQPCMECSKGLYQAGIKEIFYVHPYRLNDGLEFLKKCGIPVEQINV
jgi:dCMP deaminase